MSAQSKRKKYVIVFERKTSTFCSGFLQVILCCSIGVVIVETTSRVSMWKRRTYTKHSITRTYVYAVWLYVLHDTAFFRAFSRKTSPTLTVWYRATYWNGACRGSVSARRDEKPRHASPPNRWLRSDGATRPSRNSTCALPATKR